MPKKFCRCLSPSILVAHVLAIPALHRCLQEAYTDFHLRKKKKEKYILALLLPIPPEYIQFQQLSASQNTHNF